MTGASEGQGQEIPSPGCAGPEHGAPGPSAFARQAEPAADGAHHDGGDEEGEETVPCASPACAQCGEGAARYRCPRCSIRTCSLECVRGHKKDTGCTGKRDRTAYVPISKFDDRQLGSDYSFLEDAKLLKDNARRGRPPAPREELPHHLSTLVHQARRRSIELLLHAPGMVKRRSNTTRMDWKRHKLSWRVEWRFVRAGIACVDIRVDENMCLREVLMPHLELQPGQAAKRHKLREYIEAGVESLVFLLKKERCPANAPEYFRLEIGSSLAEQLPGKTIVEFPVLLVLLPEEAKGYTVSG